MTRSIVLPSVIAWLMVALAVSRPAPVAAVDRPREDATPGARAAQGPTVTTIPSSDALLTVRRLEGDVTGDCRVDVVDIQEIASHYPSVAGDAAYAAADDMDLNGAINIGDLQFALARDNSSCVSPYPPQPPAINASVAAGPGVSLALDPVLGNIWVCDPGQGACGASIPSQVGPQAWQQGVVLNEIMTVNVASTMVLEYSFDLQYDAAMFQAPQISDLGVLNDAGLRTTTCSQTSSGPGHAVFHCTSAGPPTQGAMWTGPRAVAHVTFALQSGALQSFSAAAGNARISDVINATASATVTTNLAPSVGGVAEAPNPIDLASMSHRGAARNTGVGSLIAAETAVAAIALGLLARRRRRRRTSSSREITRQPAALDSSRSRTR